MWAICHCILINISLMISYSKNLSKYLLTICAYSWTNILFKSFAYILIIFHELFIYLFATAL